LKAQLTSTASFLAEITGLLGAIQSSRRPPADWPGPFHSPVQDETCSTDLQRLHISWRLALAKLALPGKERKMMIKFLNPAITGRPDPLRTRSPSSCKVASSTTRNWLRFA